MKLAILLLIMPAIACGRLGFGSPADSGDGDSNGDGRLDDGGGPDVAFGNCWPAWRNRTVRFGSVRALSELATPGYEGDPFVSSDALALFFAQGGTRDIMIATRPDRVSSFGAVMVRADLSSVADDNRVSMTSNDLLAAFSSNRAGSQGFDLWESVRSSASGTFASASQMPFAQVNTTGNEHDPHLSGDGNRLWFAASTAPGQKIQFSSRASPVAPFAAPTDVMGLGLAVTADPVLSPDELVIVYLAAPDPTAIPHIHYATRTTTADAFSNPQPLPDVNSAVHDGDPQVTFDGCELFFGSQRSGNRDLYVATVQ